MEIRTKICGTCGIEKNMETEFQRRITGSPYFRKHCKQCMMKIRVYDYPTKRKEHLKRLFKLSLEEYAGMLEKQGNCCFVCKTDDPGGPHGQWSIDHDHSCCPTNKTCGKCIRGLLCASCNWALGLVKDDPNILRKLADYVEQFAVEQVVK